MNFWHWIFPRRDSMTHKKYDNIAPGTTFHYNGKIARKYNYEKFEYIDEPNVLYDFYDYYHLLEIVEEGHDENQISPG